MSAVSLAAEKIRAFEQEGVVLLPGLLSPDWVDACRQAWTFSVQNPGPLASGLLPGTDSAFQDLCNPSAYAAYREIIHDSPLADAAQALWNGSPVWYMYEQVFHKTGNAGRTPWHQDTSYLAVDGDHLIAFWISFESLPKSHGLEFVRGSHRGPLFNTSRFDRTDPTLPIFASETVPNLPDVEARRREFDIVSFATNPGDVIGFHTSVLHGGGAVDRQIEERRTLTLRFFGERSISAKRPGAAGPFYEDIRTLKPGEPFRHTRFPKVR
ncbi:MAG: phytanoyl-CoA dioxygenase family protein [Gammaproteobacteria bacterium]|nr:phytanoyl-CoA dioxygenase family protein [Gammaproteobacteria bacterium]